MLGTCPRILINISWKKGAGLQCRSKRTIDGNECGLLFNHNSLQILFPSRFEIGNRWKYWILFPLAFIRWQLLPCLHIAPWLFFWDEFGFGQNRGCLWQSMFSWFPEILYSRNSSCVVSGKWNCWQPDLLICDRFQMLRSALKYCLVT